MVHIGGKHKSPYERGLGNAEQLKNIEEKYRQALTWLWVSDDARDTPLYHPIQCNCDRCKTYNVDYWEHRQGLDHQRYGA